MDLSMYNGKRFAVVLSVGGLRHVMSGMGAYVCDPHLGPVLRVNLQHDEGSDSTGHQTLLLQEEALRDRLVADDQYGCDFRVELGTPRR